MMPRFTLTKAISAATLVLALSSPVLAQVQPIPNPGPALKPAPKPPQQPRLPTPTQPVTVQERPQLIVTPALASAHRTTRLSVKLTGLGAARAVHLYGFEPGCNAGLLPILESPLEFDNFDRTRLARVGPRLVSYTSAGHPFRPTQPARPGIPVADGTATFAMHVRIGGAVRLSPGEQATGQIDTNLPLLADYTSDGLAELAPQICQPRAVLVVQGADGTWRNLRADGSLTSLTDDVALPVSGIPWRVVGGRQVRHANSAASRDILKPVFVPVRPGSVCSGVSSVPGSQHPVGMMEDGGDLVFQIRSGPIGTHCRLFIPSRSLGDGTRVTLSFSAKTTGTKCRIGAPPAPVASPGGFVLNRLDGRALGRRRVEQTGRHTLSWSGWINPDGHTSADRIGPRTQLQAMEMELFCDITALNDHAIEVRLDEVEYIMPDGVSMPQ